MRLGQGGCDSGLFAGQEFLALAAGPTGNGEARVAGYACDRAADYVIACLQGSISTAASRSWIGREVLVGRPFFNKFKNMAWLLQARQIGIVSEL